MSIMSADWTPAEYASLLRSGGGTAEGMIERYFHFYGYPRSDLRDEVVAEENDMESAYEGDVRKQQGARREEGYVYGGSTKGSEFESNRATDVGCFENETTGVYKGSGRDEGRNV